MPIIYYDFGHYGIHRVFVGGCVARGEGSSFRHKAHVHIAGQFFGWICVRSAK